MEAKIIKLGSSLEVPNVQELAKEKSSSVPPRYVRPDQHPLFAPTARIPSAAQIPVVDFHKLLHEQTNSMASQLQLMHNACQEWGFFQLINHGVDPTSIEKMKSEIQAFFNLPIQVKKKFEEPGDIEGYGQAFVVSEEQKLDWADLFYVVTLPTHLRKPGLIPKLPETFRDEIESYSSELKNLALKILNVMAKALNMEEDDMKMLFEEGMQGMRMNYYPPCPQPELVTGLCPHSDAVGLTILLQVNEMDGLQIKKDGIWIPVCPLPNAFVINVGDILEIVSNGTYRSIEHRATTTPTKERLSIATFLSPKLDGEMGPAPSLVSHENPAKFKTIGVAEYLTKYFSKELQGKSHLDTMRI